MAVVEPCRQSAEGISGVVIRHQRSQSRRRLFGRDRHLRPKQQLGLGAGRGHLLIFEESTQFSASHTFQILQSREVSATVFTYVELVVSFSTCKSE